MKQATTNLPVPVRKQINNYAMTSNLLAGYPVGLIKKYMTVYVFGILLACKNQGEGAVCFQKSFGV